MRPRIAALPGIVACLATATVLAGPPEPRVSLHESLAPSPLRPAADPVVVRGRAAPGVAAVRLRVTTGRGTEHVAHADVRQGAFSARWPDAFPGAPPAAPGVLHIDATAADAFDGDDLLPNQAEALLILHGPPGAPPPDLPMAFTDDLIDAAGRRDADAAQFPRMRALVNRFRRGRGAALMGIRQADFDLARPADLTWFREHAALHDFDHRDRDWSSPLGNRPARGFWQAVWDRWFNASNNHPWDGNPENRSPDNFRPYTFTNDLADLAVLHALLGRAVPEAADNRARLLDDVMTNLLAMQHRAPDNFTLPDARGRREHYTAGAFRYGLFESGEWLTEGKGWFSQPRFRDYAHGGVFNGRALWAMGESLRASSAGPLAPRLREAIALTLRFCLHDGLQHGYAVLTRRGLPLWRHPGEHGYLLLGMTAALAVAPDLPVPLDPEKPSRPLAAVTADALDALLDDAGRDGTWTDYGNVNAVNIAALAAGALTFPAHPHARQWQDAARRAADAWLALTPATTAFGPLFGDRRGERMTFPAAPDGSRHADLYKSGHWVHALALLHRLTGDPAHAARADAVLSWHCGRNPLNARVLDELGAVNNRVTDADTDGIADRLRWDGYPESTAFLQIGLLHRLP